MKNILIFVFLFTTFVLSSNVYNRIGSSSSDNHRLEAGDQIISTLGYFKFMLNSNNCQLNIYQFSSSNNSYVLTSANNYLSNNGIKSCSYITIDNYRLLSDTGIQIAKLSASTYVESWLTIDDNGNIRHIGVNQKTNQTLIPLSQENIIQNVSEQNIYRNNMYANSQINFSSLNKTYNNSNKWSFNLANGVLKIQSGINSSLSRSLNIQQNLVLDRSGIYDNNNRTVPLIYFPSALLFPKCSLTKSRCEFKAPYTVQFDQQWPIVRIYDQEKYLIAQYGLNQAYYGQKIRVCPPGFFSYEGNCQATCPSPYYQKIDGEYGQCVLNCEEGAIIDTANRRCSCSLIDLNNNPYDTNMIKACETYNNWTVYFYGCDCSKINQYYDRQNTLSCQQTCPIGNFAQNGVCLNCGTNCVTCAKDPEHISYLMCTACADGYVLLNGSCTQKVVGSQTCTPNCQNCEGGLCTKCISFYSLFNQTCVLSCQNGIIPGFSSQNGSLCNLPNTNVNNLPNNCYVGCLQCNNNQCFACAEGYVLYITPLSSTCKQKNAALACTGEYNYDPLRQICYIQNPQNFNMDKCKGSILNCQTCAFNSNNKCLLCNSGFYLYNNTCVSACPQNYLAQNNVCIQQINNCQNVAAKVSSQNGEVNWNILQNSDAYKYQVGPEPANNQQGYGIYLNQQILEHNQNNVTYVTASQSMQIQCLNCLPGYGLSNDSKSCLPCPASCTSKNQLCYYADSNSCYNATVKCTFIDQNNNCMQSCPVNSYPFVDSNNVVRCFPSVSSGVQDYIKIDASEYHQVDGSRIFYYALDKQVQNFSGLTTRLLTRSFSNSDRRLLIQDEKVQHSDLKKNSYFGNYFNINSTSQYATALQFNKNLKDFQTSFGELLADSVYGAQAGQTHNQWMKDWLAYVGYILSWVILVIHCLYIGNTILYKVDNLIIFCQTIYFFTFVKLLVGNTLAQYYYGWFYMHMGFWPNYFKSTVPNQYDELDSPLSFKLATLDGNFIRNAGFAVSIFMSFLVLWIVLCLFIFILHKFFKRLDIWYERIAKNTLIAAVQLLSMVIYFFSVTQLLYGKSYYPDGHGSFHSANMAVAIIFISLITVYMVVRFFFNRIGGLYMFKKLSIALILVDAYEAEGFLALLIGLQVVFAIARFFLQKPRLLREKLFLLFEEIAYIVGYFLLFLVTVTGVNVLIITIIIFIMLLFLVADLLDVYLQSRNEAYDSDFLGQKYDNVHPEEQPQSQRKMV